ncbi:MAG: prolipoprotein diacylglyceryl transferase family protein, partial [Bacteroidota bacterium]
MFPSLFEIGSIAISSLWMSIALAFFVTGSSFIKLAVKNKLKVAFITEHFFGILLYGLIGARIIYVAFNYQDYFTEITWLTPLNLISFWDKGLSFWGGVAGMSFALYWYCKKNEESFLKWIDVFILSLLAGLIFGSIGAFLEGINYGKETSLPWGMTFQNFNIPYTLPIHPSQLYAALYTTILFFTFYILFLKEKFKNPGEMGL